MNEISLLSNELRNLFTNDVFKHLKNKKITDNTLDNLVLDYLKHKKIKSPRLNLKFSEPEDKIYSFSAGRTPYDLLCKGTINKKPVTIFINNKFGDLSKSNKNDITTYNNLLRLYFDITTQRLKDEVTINRKTIRERIDGDEIVLYAIFVMDKSKTKSNWFLLEEIKDDLYINPRNTMLQVKYNPEIEMPKDYFTFTYNLNNQIKMALEKTLKATQNELTYIIQLQNILIEIKKHYE
jgi:hypothetical protein